MNAGPLIPYILVAAGGAVGALSRFLVYRTVDTSFPWATFIVNIIGCTLASFLMFRFGVNMGDSLRTLLFVGIFGAFTTMSTFSIDTVNLLAGGNFTHAFINIILNCVVCIGGALLGRYLAML